MKATRREAIGLGLAAGAAALAPASAFAQAEGDAAILETLTALEQVAVFVYQAAADSGALGDDAGDLAQLFRDHEQQHADALGAALEALGGSRPPKPADAREAAAALRKLGLDVDLGGLAGRSGWLTLAAEIENLSLAAYHDAHKRLQDAKLLQTATSIMANEGQHLVVLRDLLGRPQVPRAFETGDSGE